MAFPGAGRGRDDAARRQTRARASYVVLCALLAALLAIATLFLIGMASASRYFERAAASQAQLATVSQIEAALFDPATGGRTSSALLARYRASIAEEARIAGHAEPDESRDAATLSALALSARPMDRAAVRALVARIADRERGEARSTAAAMRRLRTRMSLLAVLVASVAGALAIFGGLTMIAANRRLERTVAARTQALSSSNARLVEVDRSRRLFFAKASHELRTPVTVMRGEAEVALADPEGGAPALRDALAQVVVHAELLSRRIEELLGLARAEDGRIEMRADPLDLGRIAREAGAMAAAHARSAGVDLAIETPDTPLAVTGDARWLGQALLAVLDNGVKFSPEGGVLRLCARPSGGRACVEISDAGAGVASAALPRIFDAYYQTDAGRTRGGSGLGLALARWVVERHGGSIAAANRQPAGCTVAIALPLAS